MIRGMTYPLPDVAPITMYGVTILWDKLAREPYPLLINKRYFRFYKRKLAMRQRRDKRRKHKRHTLDLPPCPSRSPTHQP
jgi:hypothetical protein